MCLPQQINPHTMANKNSTSFRSHDDTSQHTVNRALTWLHIQITAQQLLGHKRQPPLNDLALGGRDDPDPLLRRLQRRGAVDVQCSAEAAELLPHSGLRLGAEGQRVSPRWPEPDEELGRGVVITQHVLDFRHGWMYTRSTWIRKKKQKQNRVIWER